MPRPSPLLPLLQAVLCAGVFLAATLYPRAGQAALYMPLAGTESLDLADAAVLGPGAMRGSLLIRVPTSRFALTALARPALVIAVPADWCGGEGRSPEPTQAPNRNSTRA